MNLLLEVACKADGVSLRGRKRSREATDDSTDKKDDGGAAKRAPNQNLAPPSGAILYLDICFYPFTAPVLHSIHLKGARSQSCYRGCISGA